MRFFLINCFAPLKILFYIVVLFFAGPAWTSGKTDSAGSPLQPDFWGKITKSAPIGVLRDWQNLHQVNKAYAHYLGLLTNSQIFQDHFYHRLKSLEEGGKGLMDLRLNSSIQQMWETLKSGSYDEMRELVGFAEENQFDKTDKILMALVLIFHNSLPADPLFDVMASLGLSVNDRLEMENLNLSPLPWLIKKSMRKPSFLEQRRGTLAVLSHFLAGTGDPEIIKRLINLGYDPSIKTFTGDNIIHSFSRINHLRALASIPLRHPEEDYEKSVRLLAKQAPELIEETNILKLSPLSLAYMTKFRPAIQALSWRKPVPPASYFSPLAYLNDGAVSDFSNRLFRKTNAKFDSRRIVYLDFEALMLHLISFIRFFNPEAMEAFQTAQGQLDHAESVRLEILSRFLYENKDSEDKKTAQQRDFFRTILWGYRGNGEPLSPLPLAREDLLRAQFVAPALTGERILISNTFLEAIRHSSLSLVQDLLHLYTLSDLMETNFPFFGLDPLSLSLVIYAGLPEERPQKKQAKKIIRILAKQVNLNELPPSLISLPPLAWAILFGLLEEARFFKNQGADMITGIKNEGWEIDLMDYAREEGFIKLGAWMEKQVEGQIEPSPGKCKRHYLQ